MSVESVVESVMESASELPLQEFLEVEPDTAAHPNAEKKICDTVLHEVSLDETQNVRKSFTAYSKGFPESLRSCVKNKLCHPVMRWSRLQGWSRLQDRNLLTSDNIVATQ